MSTIKNYIQRKVIASSFVVAIILVLIIWLSQSFRYLEFILSPYISVGQYLRLLALLLPDMLLMVAPLGVSIGTLLVYQRLAADQELLAMKVLGFSRLAILKPAFCVGITVSFFLALSSIILTPYAMRQFRDHEFRLRQHMYLNAIRPGQFTTMGPITCFVNSHQKKNTFQGVFISMYSDPKNQGAQQVIHAAKARLIYEKNYLALLLEDGKCFEHDEYGKNTVFKFKMFTIDLGRILMKSVRQVKFYEYDTLKLVNPDPLLPVATQQRMKSEGHQRILQPSLAFVDLIILSFFILRMESSRHRRRWVFFMGLFTVFIFHGVVFALLNLSARFSFAIGLSYALVFGVVLIGFRRLQDRLVR